MLFHPKKQWNEHQDSCSGETWIMSTSCCVASDTRALVYHGLAFLHVPETMFPKAVFWRSHTKTVPLPYACALLHI